MSDSNCEFINADLTVFPSFALTYDNKVEKLHLHNNKMTHISCPQIVGIEYLLTFSQITSIDLRYCLEYSFGLIPPPYLESSRFVFDLCSGNKLWNISGLLSKFVNLQSLNLAHNELTQIPSSFADMRALKKLLINDNKLESLPPALGNCKELKILECYDNPFSMK